MKEISGLFILKVDLEEGVRLLAEGVHGVWGMGLEEGHEPVWVIVSTSSIDWMSWDGDGT